LGVFGSDRSLLSPTITASPAPDPRLKHSMRALHDMPIDACDRRIAALERELAELKRYRNALTPICRLSPAETLAAILVYVQHGGQDCDVRDPDVQL
jgi:hypothetical protein